MKRFGPLVMASDIVYDLQNPLEARHGATGLFDVHWAGHSSFSRLPPLLPFS